MSGVRAAAFDISLSMLEKWLGLPAGAEIKGASVHPHGVLRVVVHDPALPEFDVPPLCDPTVSHEVIKFNWNLDQ